MMKITKEAKREDIGSRGDRTSRPYYFGGGGFDWMGYRQELSEEHCGDGGDEYRTERFHEPSAADFNTFWQAWQDIQSESLWVPSTTPQEMMYGAISGMVASLGDPYTEFFSPADSDQFQQDITGNFGGIGAELGTNTSTQIVVIVARSPARRQSAAGLKPEDVITSINGTFDREHECG